jgi:hypothetical protein
MIDFEKFSSPQLVHTNKDSQRQKLQKDLFSPYLHADEKTKRIMDTLLQNDIFLDLYASSSKLFKWGVTVRGVDPDKISSVDLNAVKAYIRRGQYRGETYSISIEYNRNLSDQEATAAIIFELVNASFEKEFTHQIEQAKEGKLQREEYVQKVEYIEWRALQKSRIIINEIIPQQLANINPKQFENFQHHLYIQEKSGHTEVYRNQWKKIASNHEQSALERVSIKKSNVKRDFYPPFGFIAAIAIFMFTGFLTTRSK